MNKQEVLKKLEGISKTGCTRWVVYDEAKELIEQINEPERVKLTKAQEDYLLGFGDIENEGSIDWTAALYYIVRVGWGYLFTAAPGAGSDEIPLNSDYYKKLSGNLDIDDLKTLLIKALVNGYEVEKEKRYTARLKVVTIKESGYLNRHNKNGSITIDTSYTAGGQYQVYFTRSELEDLDIWDNPAFEIEEVE
ncbi:DUF1642 domain-containing protein [Streptococcus anginosus]|jgi:hypothetical protein|uniref:DUF1642 domain-containing protein n=1 Tax=Streptococcus anginosus TaxID=1328 RepID=UPI002000AB26|nr:DUF1642 domain-containing protein [Streptococcus anginosus]